MSESDIHSPEFFERFAADLEALRKDSNDQVHLDLDISTAVMLVAQLQLAQRHPGNTGDSSRRARTLVASLINKLASTSTIRRALEAGNDPAHDVPPGG
jgi:hypothetical protein